MQKHESVAMPRDYQDLHQDVLAVSQSQIQHIDRLWAELSARINDFKQLLDQQARNETSRKLLLSGKTAWRESTMG